MRKDESSLGLAGEGSSQGGWDPYEVWRTRILLPRLERERDADATESRDPASTSGRDLALSAS